MADNPLLADLDRIKAELARQEQALAALQAQETDMWRRNFEGVDMAVAQVRNQMVPIREAIARLKEELAAKLRAIEAVDVAAAQAVANGMTPEAAYQKALADLQRAKAIKYVGIAIAILIVLLAIYWFVWRKKKG